VICATEEPEPSLPHGTFWHPSFYTDQTPWPESASELYRPNDRRLSAKLVPIFADRGCHVVSVTDPYGRILGFLDRSRYCLFQVAPQLYSRGWVDPVPDPLLRKSGNAGNRTRAPGCVARNSDHRGCQCLVKHINYRELWTPFSQLKYLPWKWRGKSIL
jgi:hypothetical protein